VHRAFTLLVILLASEAAAQEARRPPPSPEPSCISCHRELDGGAREPVLRAADDVHFQKGLSCHDCHGGNPTAGFDGDIERAHDAAKGWTGKPARTRIPLFCARCHADADFMKRFDPHTRVDQLAEYRTSVHGKRNAAGDAKTAVCVDCHGVHGIRAVGDPRSSVYPTNLADTCARCHANEQLMGAYGLPTRQHADYRTSVHARALYEKGDLSAPTCNDCHGSHGAVPPGVSAVGNVCGSCHGREATLFRETEAKKKMDLSMCIQCMVCHGNHAVQPPTDEMLGVGPKSTCISCHVEGDKEYRASKDMADAAARLRSRLGEARTLLDRAERAGMEVSADRFALQKAQDQLVQVKVLVHSFDEERFLAAAEEGTGVAEAGVAAGHRAFRELRQRRLGLGVSLVVILAVIVGLALKLREIERPQP
jgi:Cytochrome c3